MNSQTSSELWEFSTDFYKDREVKSRCLDLQDVYDANVDILLWLCWLHSKDIRLERAALLQANNIVGGVNRNLLSGLRDLRSELIASSSFTRVQEQLIRKQIVNAELAIEKILLMRLQDVTSRLPRVTEDDEYLTLFDYLHDLGIQDSAEIAAFLLNRALPLDVLELEEASA